MLKSIIILACLIVAAVLTTKAIRYVLHLDEIAEQKAELDLSDSYADDRLRQQREYFEKHRVMMPVSPNESD